MKDQLKNIKDIIRLLSELEIFLKNYKTGNDEIISIFELKLLSIKGYEYVVFKYKNKVIKIHRKNFIKIDNLNEQNILSLINIPTKRILMPTDPIYSTKGNIVGYAMNLVTEEKDISNESIDHFLEEMNIIDQDKRMLNENLVLLKDLHIGNAIYNDQINIIDSGRYINTTVFCPNYINDHMRLIIEGKDRKRLNDYIQTNNTTQVNNFLYKYIMQTILSKNTTKEKSVLLSKIHMYLEQLSTEMNTKSYIDIIEYISSKNMTVKEVAKQLQKKIA